MNLTRAHLLDHLGRWVTVANPDPHLATAATWYGRLIALSDDPTVVIQAPGGGGQGVFPQAFAITPADPPDPGTISPRRQAAYDAVYAVINRLGTELPPDPVHRNAMIWRAVTAALDAANIPVPADPTPASSSSPAPPPGHTVQHSVTPGDTSTDSVTTTELGRALEESHDGWALDLSPECAEVMAERLLRRFSLRPRTGTGHTGDTVSAPGGPGDKTSPAGGGHVHLPVPLDEPGRDLTSGVPARPHPEDTGDTSGDTSGDGVRFAYRATVRRGQVRHAIAEAFDLLGAELAHPQHPEEEGRRDA